MKSVLHSTLKRTVILDPHLRGSSIISSLFPMQTRSNAVKSKCNFSPEFRPDRDPEDLCPRISSRLESFWLRRQWPECACVRVCPCIHASMCARVLASPVPQQGGLQTPDWLPSTQSCRMFQQPLPHLSQVT